MASGSLSIKLDRPRGHLTSNLITKKGLYLTSFFNGEFLTIGTFYLASYTNNDKEKSRLLLRIA